MGTLCVATDQTRAARRCSASLHALLLSSVGAVRALADGPIDSTWDGGTANWSAASHWSANPQIPNGSFHCAHKRRPKVTVDANYGVVGLSIDGGTLTGTNAGRLASVDCLIYELEELPAACMSLSAVVSGSLPGDSECPRSSTDRHC